MRTMAEPTLCREQIAGMNIHYLNYSLDFFLDAQQRLGFKSLELWCGAPHVWIDHMSYYDTKEIRKKIESRGLKVQVVTPENCLYPYQVAAKEPDHVKRSMDYFKNGICFAEELGCSMMEINSGWGYKNEDPQEAWKRSAYMLSSLAEEAGKHGVTLVLESLRPEESQIVTNLCQTQKMIGEVNSRYLKPMADLCAVSVAGESLEDWFKTFGDDLKHIHFVDGDPYGHLVWGDGTHHLGKEISILNQYHYNGYLGQEITDGRYYNDPVAADFRNIKNFERYIME